MAWVAFDRAVRAVEDVRPRRPGRAVARLRPTRCTARCCEQGFDAERNTFTQYYGSKALDASTLMIPLVGFLPPGDPRVAGTVEAIERELVVDGFVTRYDSSGGVDGLPAGEGVFLPCSFWLADNLGMIGRRDEARRAVRAPARAPQRRRAALGGVRPGHPAHARQLPAGVHPRVAGEHRIEPHPRGEPGAAPGCRESAGLKERGLGPAERAGDDHERHRARPKGWCACRRRSRCSGTGRSRRHRR